MKRKPRGDERRTFQSSPRPASHINRPLPRLPSSLQRSNLSNKGVPSQPTTTTTPTMTTTRRKTTTTTTTKMMMVTTTRTTTMTKERKLPQKPTSFGPVIPPSSKVGISRVLPSSATHSYPPALQASEPPPPIPKRDDRRGERSNKGVSIQYQATKWNIPAERCRKDDSLKTIKTETTNVHMDSLDKDMKNFSFPQKNGDREQPNKKAISPHHPSNTVKPPVSKPRPLPRIPTNLGRSSPVGQQILSPPISMLNLVETPPPLPPPRKEVLPLKPICASFPPQCLTYEATPMQSKIKEREGREWRWELHQDIDNQSTVKKNKSRKQSMKDMFSLPSTLEAPTNTVKPSFPKRRPPPGQPSNLGRFQRSTTVEKQMPTSPTSMLHLVDAPPPLPPSRKKVLPFIQVSGRTSPPSSTKVVTDTLTRASVPASSTCNEALPFVPERENKRGDGKKKEVLYQAARDPSIVRKSDSIGKSMKESFSQLWSQEFHSDTGKPFISKPTPPQQPPSNPGRSTTFRQVPSPPTSMKNLLGVSTSPHPPTLDALPSKPSFKTTVGTSKSSTDKSTL